MNVGRRAQDQGYSLAIWWRDLSRAERLAVIGNFQQVRMLVTLGFLIVLLNQ